MDKKPRKVTQEVLDFIELHNDGMSDWKNSLLAQHTQAWIEGFKDIKEEAKCIEKYSPMDFARILDGQYELELTPQETIKQKYIKSTQSRTAYDNEFAKGIKYVLHTLNIKIEGVND
ncbi:hypothetical protein M3_0150 [Lysinibacillus phage vB_LfM_LysYB1]|nr:hypothetical protein M3_0150 [Lysinibacillus phage vB_LfM_LysYB1]WAB25339.1 hypothetical protein M5_0161 [Lysinibacillus phage vB_LfM_LysYB2]